MPTWLVYSLVLWVLLAITDVVYRRLFGLGYDPVSLVFWSMAIGLVISGAYVWMSGETIKIPQTGEETLFIIGIGVLFFAGFYLLRKSQKEAPNLGAVNAIVYSSVVATLILMHVLYGDRLTWRMLFGGALIVFGIGLIGMDQIRVEDASP